MRRIKDWEAGRHQPKDPYRLLYCRVFGIDEAELFGEISRPGNAAPLDDVVEFAAWIEQSNVGDNTIAILAEKANRLAENHTRTPPRRMLADVAHLHGQTQTLIRGGKQRLCQTRDLLRIEADVLAHACILLGDLHDDEAAIIQGMTAALCAEEAGANTAPALSAQAKTERWRNRYQASADVARRGFERSPSTSLRILLACQEANAAGLLGDFERAQGALRRAEEARDTIATDSGISPWSCPRPRQALFGLSVALQSGDADAALQAAQMADDAWDSGEPFVYGTWAQIRFGAGNAYVMLGDLNGAADQIVPAMGMSPALRMATITSYLVQMDKRLQDRRFHGSDTAADLREQIRNFNAGALPTVVEEDR